VQLTNEQKIGDFYASCMDTVAIDSVGSPADPGVLQILFKKRF
jgi:hypothetical protein